MTNLTPEMKTLPYWEKVFRDGGVKPSVAQKFFAEQEHFRWHSRFDYHEQAQRWIDNATPDERLPPEKHWKPFGNTLEVQRICAQDALFRERSTPGTYSPSELRDIHAFLNPSA